MTDVTLLKNDFCISTDKTKLDIDSIYRFLSTKAYWSLNIPRTTVEQSIQNSLCFGVYLNDKQVGFARVISDYATIAYLGDVYVLEEYRGKGLSKWLMETIVGHPNLQGLRRWILLTGDAHGLYRQFGWTELADPTRWMERHNKNVYAVQRQQ
ncbi:MAG TPA: GNAT family N-acetyltransferase [Chryseosolibacter sp.]